MMNFYVGPYLVVRDHDDAPDWCEVQDRMNHTMYPIRYDGWMSWVTNVVKPGQPLKFHRDVFPFHSCFDGDAELYRPCTEWFREAFSEEIAILRESYRPGPVLQITGVIAWEDEDEDDDLDFWEEDDDE